jgi:hypothetical protein
MKNTFKRLLLGALIGGALLGALTKTAPKAFAAEQCDPCSLDGSDNLSGYLIATGVTFECSTDPDGICH